MTMRDVTAMITQAVELQGRRFAVIRGTGSDRWDGRWLDLDQLEMFPPVKLELTETSGQVELRPTGEVERRDDGMLAVVVRPV